MYYSEIVLYLVDQFNEGPYIKCVTEEPLMSVQYYAHTMFDYMLHYIMGCRYSSNTLVSRCLYVSRFFFGNNNERH